jgi:hypothetical protein
MFDDLKSVMTRVLKFGLLLVLGISLMGSLAGFFVAGMSGVFGALVGGSAVLIFTGMTALSVVIGSKLPLAGFVGTVLGGWLIKMVLFLVIFRLIDNADWLTQEARPVVFFTIVAAVVGGLILDTMIVSKARFPVVTDQA